VRPARSLLALATLAAVAVTFGGADAASGQRAATRHEPVPSLEPAKTEALWRSLVTRQPRDLRAQAACRPLRAVFYAASDWLRLATKLAATASPCAEYYISVPPLVADKTTFRRDQASRIRALGPNVHAMAEIHFATWTRWVQSTGSSWHQAGVTARERMAEAGYAVALGDTWALNELTSAVRRGDGSSRTNIREFLRGLYEGGGSRPTPGAALVIGFGQRTGDVSVYQDTLQNWLSDTAFWTDMATYVSDWSQEVYGDLRSHAVPGQSVSTRREYLNDYLQHKLVLASVGPSTIEPARAYLREAYSPLANAAWPRETAWGWTMVPAEQMSAYISSQVNAMRYFSASSGQARDHWGFAWAPRNTTGLSNADFAAQTGQLLDRLAAAIRDSGNVVEPENPGSGACGPPGQETFCLVDLAEARHNEAWRSFRTWTQAAISIGNGVQTLQAGAPSAPMTITLVTPSGLPISGGGSRVVTLGSSSPQGTFSTSPAGPWTSTLTLTAAPGTSVTFYYRDTLAGRHTLTASGQGVTAATGVVTVVAGPAVALALDPSQSSVRARSTRRLVAAARDAFGNATAATVTWTVTPAALGTVVPGSAGSAVFTAGRVLGTGTITARTGGLTGTAAITVLPGTLRIASLKATPTRRGLRVLVGVADSARRPISRATLTVVVQKENRRVFRDRAVTGSGGKALFRVRVARGCYRVVLTRAIAQGFRWTGATPSRRVCRR
jgi:hypothetical protein